MDSNPCFSSQEKCKPVNEGITKKLSENASKKPQITCNALSQRSKKRFHNCFDVENPLEELQIVIEIPNLLCVIKGLLNCYEENLSMAWGKPQQMERHP
jgi:hypothetical protein